MKTNSNDIDQYITPHWNDPEYKLRRIPYIYDEIETTEDRCFVKIKNDIVVKKGEGSKYVVRATYSVDNNEVYNLSIQRFTNSNGNPHKISLSFDKSGIKKLFNLICDLELASLGIPLNLKDKSIFDAAVKELQEINLTEDQLNFIHYKIIKDSKYIDSSNLNFIENKKITNKGVKELLNANPTLLDEIIASEISTKDVIAIGYRKKQLDVFSNLLVSNIYFKDIKSKIYQKDKIKITNEGTWQRFFEKNSWIFGYGLNYIFNTPLEGLAGAFVQKPTVSNQHHS